MAPIPSLPLLLPLLLHLAAASEDQQAPININKCCLKSQRFDEEKLQCVPETWRIPILATREVLKPPIDAEAASWLPDVLRSRTVIAHYSKGLTSDFFAIFKTNDSSVMEEFLRIDASKRRFARLKDFHPPLSPREVWKQTFCFERSLHSPVGDLLISCVLTRQLNKCCPQGERLATDIQSCVAAEDATPDWLPATPFVNVSGIRNEQIEIDSSFFWNVAVPVAEEDNTRWRLMAPPGRQDLTAWVRGSVGGREVQGVAWEYCFDAVAPGEFSPLVLLAAVADVRKCCSRTQHLSANGQKCEAVKEEEEIDWDEEKEEMGFLAEEKVENSTWLPATLSKLFNASDGVVMVMYNMHWDLNLASVFVLDADVAGDWVLEFPADTPPEMWLLARSLKTFRKLRRWCFDTQATRGRVLLAEVPCKAPSVLCLPKCCPTGSLLKADGSCHTRPVNVRDWDPNHSTATRFLPRNRTPVAFYDPLMPCFDGSFVTHTPDGKSAAHLLQDSYEKETFRVFSHCADMQLSDHGAPREVFAYCELPPIGRIFLVIRSLQLMAVLFLAVGLAVILRDENTRRSVHGCALACHAFCLLLSNSLQTAWFFVYQYSSTCVEFAFAIYFFLVSAGVWLNVVSINMTLGFRRPLGAHAAGQRMRPIWRSLALWSVYGWGVPAALTALSVSMYINRHLLDENYAIPIFIETRTCFGETFIIEGETGRTRPEPLFYYYVPMSLLVVANGVCLGLTTSIIMAMKKETAVLYKLGANTAARRGLQNARMYVKLLLSAGLLDILVEVVAYTARPHDRTSNIGIRRAEALQTLYIFHIVGTFVDVARALAVLLLATGRWRWPWAWPCSWWRRMAAMVLWRRWRLAPTTSSASEGHITLVGTITTTSL